ncbi:MAG: hypothetical protein CR974_02030 [Gammaproteobacteria bacterium]|nr:MAG: hypothetical protein CR974_02030 [Gammaproteobacteria bacterium]
MINFLLFLVCNFLVLLFLFLTVKNYRLLNRQLDNADIDIEKTDALSVSFIEKIFHHYPNQSEIKHTQKKIIRNAMITSLLLIFSQYI